MSFSNDMAYLAGLMDGEGTWSIQCNVRYTKKGKPNVHFSPKMSMTLKHGNEVLEELKSNFGGAIYTYDDGMNRWSLNKRIEIINASNELLPYLRIKKHICERMLYALSIFPDSRANHAAGERSWTLDMSLEVAEIALTLNPKSARKTKKTEDYISIIEQMYDET